SDVWMKKKRIKREQSFPCSLSILMLLLTLTAAISTGAYAQSEEEETTEQKQPHQLGEVVVTATKSETEVQDVTASVKVFSQEDLKETGARVLTDALHQTAGLQMNECQGNGEMSMVSMRGMPLMGSRYVHVLVDGVPRNTARDSVDWSAIPLVNIERVEIIKGPASALYGKNALGGVINIITKTGGTEHQVDLTAGYGSYGENKEGLVLSGPLGKDGEVGGYTAGLSRRAGKGWRDENNDFDRINNFLRLNGQLSDSTFVGFSLDYALWDLEWPDYLPAAQYEAGAREEVFFKHGLEEHDEVNAALKIEYELSSNLLLINRTYGQDLDEQVTDLCDFMNIDSASQRLGNELRLVSDNELWNRKSQTTFGYQLEQENYDEKVSYSQYFDPGLANIPFRDAETSRTFNSLYVQNELHLSEDLTMTAGLRYDHISIDLDNLLDATASRDSEFGQFSPKAGFSWTLTPDLSLFANLGTGFKTPEGAQIATNANIKPEEAINYEVGVKTALLDRAYLQVSLYRTDMDSQLVMVPDLGRVGDFRYENAGESRMQGVEVEADIELEYGFRLIGSYTYNESYYVDFVDYAMNYSDHDLPWQPRHKTTLELRYAHDSGFGCSLTSRWVGVQWLDNENSYEQDAYNLVDAKLKYSKGMFEGSLSMRNLFDTDYVVSGENWGDGDVYLTPGDPLTVYGEVTLHF
ncbi:TonB-dependent receptor, partial [Desulfobulbus sp. TB]|nr:TonB-dependent receptor [Desulfobulbus sp. TB]